MEFNTIDGRVVGLVLDISSQSTTTGRRVLDVVKKQLIEFLRRGMDGEDLFYLYHPDVLEPVQTVGNMVADVGNYETDGWRFDLAYALAQTYLVVSAEDQDWERVIIFVTDRLEDPAPLQKLLRRGDRDGLGVNFLFVGIGKCYCRSALQRVEHPLVTVRHLEEPKDLSELLLKGGDQ